MTDDPATPTGGVMNEAEKKKPDVLQATDDAARRQARGLLRLARHGALATLEPEDGHPLATRTAVATDIDGTPIILISRLSGHTAALAADPRCSLLVGEPGKGDPLAHPRMSVACRAVKAERGTELRERCKRRYLARNPKAELYAEFPDFDFFRLEVLRASLNGGFGKAYALTAGDLVLDEATCAPLVAREAGAVSHMNEDHGDAVKLYAEVLLKEPEGAWVLAGLDPEGADLRLGDRHARLWYDEHLDEGADMKGALVALAKKARSLIAGQDQA
ncbi:HugZ family protein [Roseibium aestuarii]|uniref:HugZ family protein n=1 Tax=Roseibium aestuarii TaxID=2600299 RepID=A0ABW4K0E2_9HYPH|nr:DUF2470 domain-containing protein [Roseibium aestuarii]